MKRLIKKLLRENLNGENLRDFYNRFKQTNTNPNFLENNFKNPNFELRLTNEGGVKMVNFNQAESNRCETNSFKFVKTMIQNDDHRFYPVSGWAFMKSTTYFEHFWVYDAVNNMFLDVTPLNGEVPYAYGGVINKDINDEIMDAESVFDVSFFKGKTSSSLYSNCESKPSIPKIDSFSSSKKSYDSKLFDYIAKNSKYHDLNELIKNNNISNLHELVKLLPKLKESMMQVRNNKEYNLYDKLIRQIKSLMKEV
jgi:hypothetical protein